LKFINLQLSDLVDDAGCIGNDVTDRLVDKVTEVPVLIETLVPAVEVTVSLTVILVMGTETSMLVEMEALVLATLVFCVDDTVTDVILPLIATLDGIIDVRLPVLNMFTTIDVTRVVASVDPNMVPPTVTKIILFIAL